MALTEAQKKAKRKKKKITKNENEKEDNGRGYDSGSSVKSSEDEETTDPDLSIDKGNTTRNNDEINSLDMLNMKLIKMEQSFNAKLEAMTKVLESKEIIIAKLNQEIGSLKSEVNNQKTKINELEKGLNYMSTETADLKEVFKESSDKNKESISQLQEKTTDLEDRGRRENLVFFGIKEMSDKHNVENCDKIVTEILIKQGVFHRDDLHGSIFDRAHRLGPRKQNSERPRPIICKFSTYRDKEFVLKNSYKLKGTSIGVSEDFSKPTLEIRYQLVAKAKAARDQHGFIKGFRLNYRRLILKYEDTENKQTFFKGYSLSDTQSSPTWYVPQVYKKHNI